MDRAGTPEPETWTSSIGPTFLSIMTPDSSPFYLKGLRAAVLGATSGIGRAVAVSPGTGPGPT